MSIAVDNLAQVEKREQKAAFATKTDSPSSLKLPKRIPEIDGLRGIAIMVCLFFHYVFMATRGQPPQPLGYLHAASRLLWSGVDLFFVISGFLIGGILMDVRDSPNYFSTFYIRRFFRILPLYFLFIGLVALAYRFIYPAVGAPMAWIFEVRLPWYSYLTFLNNFGMSKENSTGPTILAVTWSLAVEEQFYLALPLLIRSVRRSALPYVFIAGIVIAPIVRLFIVFHYRAHLWATYVLLPCRMDSLLLGALCAYCVREPSIWKWMVNHRRSLMLLCLGLIVGMPALNSDGVPFTLLYATLGYGWMSLFYSTILMLALTGPESFLSRTMRRPRLASLGEIGYSVYLFHLGIYCLCMTLITGHGWVLRNWKDFGVSLFAVAITFGIAKLTWKYFERPILRWGHSWHY
jgi:peptidoglycan/LPS O-acetylase OafA/YrhL